jgi:ATP-dependent Lon protease
MSRSQDDEYELGESSKSERMTIKSMKKKDLNLDEFADSDFHLRNIDTTNDIPIPQDPLKRIIGQDQAIHIARVAAYQRRNLLLIGPPGIGKSMIAQALSFYLGKPSEEIWVVHNPENPERPFVERKGRHEIQNNKYQSSISGQFGQLTHPSKVPFDVAVKLGYACEHCKKFSIPETKKCPHCFKVKRKRNPSRFGDLLSLSPFQAKEIENDKVSKAMVLPDGREEILLFQAAGNAIRVFDQKGIEDSKAKKGTKPMKVLVPLRRSLFVQATGASATELLGDCLHDPYGGHHKLGTPPFKRVVSGAIHEAHQGVLFIDEISQLGNLQRNLLTAMQEKKYPIIGRNPQSAGAAVRVEEVPCDFVLVAACNIADLPKILPPIRSRIQGDGYEVLLKTTMADNETNRRKIVQFIAQEIRADGKIPPMNRNGIYEIMKWARIMAKKIDKEDSSLTLRLRELAGLIKAAGDLAIIKKKEHIGVKQVRTARELSKTLEEQINERYGSFKTALKTEKGDYVSHKEDDESPYNLWNA